MKNLKSFLFSIVLFFLVACDASFGEKYTIGNLEIYFTEFVGQRYVIATGDYFHKNGLIQENKHSIQLTSDQNGYIMKMVINDSYTELPESQNKNLEFLEKEIRNTVFDSLNFRIEVCNTNFKPIKPNNP